MKTENFPTDSFILASFLLCESIPLIGMNTTNPRRVVFLFEESQRRKELTEKFLAHKSLVEPHRYFSAQKDLKQMIYQEK